MKSKLITSQEQSHLGGNLSFIDKETFSELVWKFILTSYNPTTLLDVGSGLGFTSEWFINHGVNVTSIEGLRENVINAKVPTIEHDLTISSFKKNVDIVICIEVVEHIYEDFLNNVLDTLCCGRMLLMTHGIPGQKGYHHVNCQPSEYWISHITSRGYMLLEKDSVKIRELASIDGAKWIAQNAMVFKKI